MRWGAWLADKADVIALQEGWDKDRMEKDVLVAAANRRKQLGLEPFYVAGPPDVDGGLFKDALRDVAQAALGGDEGSSGGVWTLSKYPIAQTDFHTYSAHACKGEDCFKAKSVFWTRIMLNPPTPANTACLSPSTLSRPECGAPPSGGDYVDVFNTHLNATGTTLCSDDAMRAKAKAELASVSSKSALAVYAAKFLQDLYDSEFNCGISDETIQRRQLDEMNTFIESHAAKDRPAVIMGDFNIDGRQLGDANSQYRELIRRLRIGPIDPQALYGNTSALDDDDMANPWPLDFDWDIDHGDLARQWHVPYPSDGKCMGTFIGTNPGDVDYRNGCPEADNADGHLRYDYILVRPPHPSDDPNFVATTWVAEKVDSQPWRSPYPGTPPAGSVFSGPPERLSDHKPVLVGIEHAKLEVAPKFHPTWKHTLELRVASYDASNQDDCYGCGDVDPYVSRWAAVWDQFGQPQWPLQGNDSLTCGNEASDSFPPAGCMVDWNVLFMHEGTEQAHAFGPYLFDADNSSADDPLYLANGGTQPTMWVLWGAPTQVFLRGWNGQSLGTPDWSVPDTKPIPISTTVPGVNGPTSQCLLFTANELPPGQQF
jgi:endonuclease/exonuclease/phosphatase family metal-dependent hydrolase